MHTSQPSDRSGLQICSMSISALGVAVGLWAIYTSFDVAGFSTATIIMFFLGNLGLLTAAFSSSKELRRGFSMAWWLASLLCFFLGGGIAIVLPWLSPIPWPAAALCALASLMACIHSIRTLIPYVPARHGRPAVVLGLGSVCKSGFGENGFQTAVVGSSVWCLIGAAASALTVVGISLFSSW